MSGYDLSTLGTCTASVGGTLTSSSSDEFSSGEYLGFGAAAGVTGTLVVVTFIGLFVKVVKACLKKKTRVDPVQNINCSTMKPIEDVQCSTERVNVNQLQDI